MKLYMAADVVIPWVTASQATNSIASEISSNGVVVSFPTFLRQERMGGQLLRTSMVSLGLAITTRDMET